MAEPQPPPVTVPGASGAHHLPQCHLRRRIHGAPSGPADELPVRGLGGTLTVVITVQSALSIKVLIAGWSNLDPAWLAATAALLLYVQCVAASTYRSLWAALAAARDGVVALQTELAQANTDHLTGLPTRRFIYRYLEQASRAAAVTVAFVDVNGLKAINDRLGHAAGDDHLAAVADRLAAATGRQDMLVRLGGDEFAVATTRSPDQLAAALRHVLAASGGTTGQAVPPLASVGIAAAPGGDPHVALGRAEAAMRTAKQRHHLLELYQAARDGTPQPPRVRPAIRQRDQRPGPTTAP